MRVQQTETRKAQKLTGRILTDYFYATAAPDEDENTLKWPCTQTSPISYARQMNSILRSSRNTSPKQKNMFRRYKQILHFTRI